jgi:outer membrane protein TolC
VEQARKIELAVATSHETLRRTVAEARLSEEAMRLFGAVVDGQREKFQLGTATLLDVLNVEDSRTGARLSAIAARRRYAVALAEFRHETGTLLGEDGCAPPPPTTLDQGVGTCAR